MTSDIKVKSPKGGFKAVDTEPLRGDFDDPGFDSIDFETIALLEDQRASDWAALQAQLRQTVSMEQAVTAAQSSQYAPVASADFIIASSMSGLTFEDPVFDQLLAREQKKMEEGRSVADLSRSAGLTTTKLGFLALQTLWDESLLSRGIRTGVQMNQGQSLVDAYRRAGTSPGVAALTTALRGNPVDIGQGAMPGYTKPSESPEFAQSMVDLRDAPISDQDKLTRSLDAQYDAIGKPIVPIQQEVAESTLIHKQKGNVEWVSPVSPGRAIGIQVFEPGSKPFSMLSGAVDFTAQIVADPADKALLKWASYRKARNLFIPDIAQGTDAAETAMRVSQAQQVRRAGGVFGNTRFSVSGVTATQWAATTGRRMREFLVKNKSMRAVKVMFPDIDIKSARKLIDAEDIEAVDEVLLPLLGTSVLQVPGGRSLLGTERSLSQVLGSTGFRGGSRALGREVGSLAGMNSRIAFNAYTNPLTRLFTELHKGRLLASDPDATFRTADDFMRNAGFTPESADNLLYKLSETVEGDITMLHGVASEMLEEYKSILIRQGWDEDVAEGQAKMVLQMNRLGQYNIDDVANPIFLSTTFDFDGIEDIGKMNDPDFSVNLPEAHLIDEYVTWGMSLPDARSVRIGRSRMRRYRRDILREWNDGIERVDIILNGRTVPNNNFDRPAGRDIHGAGPEAFEETGEMLTYAQKDINEIIPEGGHVTTHTDASEASTVAGDNALIERYGFDDFVEEARMGHEDPLVVRPQDATVDEMMNRFGDELNQPEAVTVTEPGKVSKETVAESKRLQGEIDPTEQLDRVKAWTGKVENRPYGPTDIPPRQKISGGYRLQTALGDILIVKDGKTWKIQNFSTDASISGSIGGSGFKTLKEAEEVARKQYSGAVSDLRRTADSRAADTKALEARRAKEVVPTTKKVAPKQKRTYSKTQKRYTFEDGTIVRKTKTGEWSVRPKGEPRPTATYKSLKEATEAVDDARLQRAVDNPNTEFTDWFSKQRSTGGKFFVVHPKTGKLTEVKTPRKMKEHIRNGAEISFEPKARKQTVASMRSWYKRQVADGAVIEVRTPARNGDSASPWRPVEDETALISAMGDKADVRVLPDGNVPQTTSTVVYGKSLNVHAMDLDAADPKLIRALISDGLVKRVDGVLTRVEGAEPKKIFEWMDDNGYGKYVNEDGTVEALERYSGYDTKNVFDDITRAEEYETFAYKNERLSQFLQKIKVFDDPTKLFGFKPSVIAKALDSWQSTVFKPIVLLRAAWFARVTLEENVRAWMNGFDSFVSSPYRAMQWVMNDFLAGKVITNKAATKFRKGRFDIGSVIEDVDEFGLPVISAEYDTLIDSRTTHAALSNVVDQMRLGRNGTMNEIVYVPIKRGDPGYTKAWARDIEQIMRSPEMGRVLNDGVEETIVWMKTTREGQQMRRRIALDTSARSPKRIIETDDVALRQHLESLNARAQRIAGGEYIMRRADGTWVSSQNINVKLPDQELLNAKYGNGETYVTIRQGDAEVFGWMRDGKLGKSDFRGTGRSNKRQRRIMRDELKRIHGDSPNAGPAMVKGTGDDMPRGTTVGGVWDDLIKVGFNFLGAKPTNYLSRSPFFRQAYWDSIGRMFLYADDELRAYILNAVKKSNLEGASWNKILKRNGRLDEVAESTRVLTIDDTGLIDDLSKAKALDMTQSTLYDLSKRKNISQMTRFLFPFGEAFLEILQVWGKLIRKNPSVIRRGQQLMNGARSTGFFHENDFGDEVFTIPGSKWLSQVTRLAPEGTAVGVDIPIQSLNMVMANPMIGFGQIAQVGASLLLPQTGTLADVAEPVIFGGYARPKIKNIVDPFASSLVPPWLRSLWTGLAGEGSEWSNTYAATVNDTAEIMMMANPEKYGITKEQNPDGTYATPRMTNDQIEAIYADSRKKALALFVVKSVLSFGSPGTPQLRWEVETNNGSALTLRALKSIWSTTLRANDYNVLEATQRFYERVGFDPTYMVATRTQPKWERANTTPGYALEVENKADFDKYPSSAGLAYQDPPWAEFSYNVMLKRQDAGDRVTVTNERHSKLVGARGGDLEYQHQLALIEQQEAIYVNMGVPQSEIRRWKEQNIGLAKNWLRNAWPSWGTDEDFNPRTTADDVWREMTITDGGWKGDILETDAGKGLLLFMPYWRNAQQSSVDQGLSPEGWLNSPRGLNTQMDLRNMIEQIVEVYPDFKLLAQRAILPQMRLSSEAWYEQNPRSPLIFDPLTPPDVVGFKLDSMMPTEQVDVPVNEQEMELVSP